MEQLWYLEHGDVTGIFCPTQMQMQGRTHQHHTYAKGDYIFMPDELADRVYFVLRGRIKIGTFSDDGKQIIKAIPSKGEVFGELALAGLDRRRDFALAMEETELCSIHRDELKNVMSEKSGLQLFLMKVLGNRMRTMESRLESLVFKDSRTRIIELVCQLVQEQGEPVGFEVVIRRFITHQEIAKMTATSRQTVTTVMNDLRNRNIISFNRKRLLVRDIKALKNEAGLL